MIYRITLLLVFSFLISHTSFCYIPTNKNQQIASKNKSIFLPHKNNFGKASNPSTDTLMNSIRKLFIQANKLNQQKKANIALELYNQFVNLAISQNYECYFWKDIRTSLSYMSNIASQFLDAEKSVNYLKKALEITLKYNPNDFDNNFYFLFKIAQNYYGQCDYNKSLDYYNHAEALFTSSNSLSINNEAILDNNIALCYLKLGSYRESNNYINKSIETEKKLRNYYNLAKNYNNIGLLFQSKKDYSEAVVCFNKSIFLYDSLLYHDKSAFVINNIGNLFLEKLSFDTCKYFYQKSLNIRKNFEKPDNTDLIQSYNNVAIVNLKLNNLDSALIFNNIAIALNTLGLTKENQSEYFSVSDFLISIADRIEINTQLYKISKDIKYLSESFTLFQSTIEVFIDRLINFSSITSTNIFINANKRFFDSSMLSSYILDSIQKSDCPLTLIVSETYKSLSLFNMQSEIRNVQSDSLSFNHFGNLNNYYKWQMRLLNMDSTENKSSKLLLIDSLIISVLEIDLYKNKFIKALKSNLREYLSNLPDSLLAICRKLDNRLLLDYYIDPNFIFINSISKTGISCSIRPTTKDFLLALQEYPISIRTLDLNASVIFSKLLSLNLLESLSDKVNLQKNITIIPDQYLTEIPFEALPFHNAYFIETKNISYRFTVLKRNYSNISITNKYANDFFAIAPFTQSDTSYHNLNASAKEITDITDLFNARKLNAFYLIGNNATYANFKNRTFNSKVFHFATHSYINNHSSDLSFLELFPTNDQLGLFLPALSSIPFCNELLVLNACETGSNLINASTGFVSFIRNLSNIAIQNYICTLWKIFDKPSHDFILKFYQNVLNGCNYNEALSQAKRAFINSTMYNYPLFWSPFILYENN